MKRGVVGAEGDEERGRRSKGRLRKREEEQWEMKRGEVEQREVKN